MGSMAIHPAGNEAVKYFIEAFGIKWEGLRSFTLNIEADDVVTIDCCYYVPESAISSIAVFVEKKFEVREIESVETPIEDYE